MRSVGWALLFAVALFTAAVRAQEPGAASTIRTGAGLIPTLETLRAGLTGVAQLLANGDASAASSTALRLYLDHYEAIEAVYGPGGPRAARELSQLVTVGESEFHRLMGGGDAAELGGVARTLRARLDAIEKSARSAGVPLDAVEMEVAGTVVAEVDPLAARTTEIRTILAELDGARSAHGEGRTEEAKTRVESVYLERVEPLEARIPASTVHRIESLFHLQLRPALARGAPASEVQQLFATLDAELISADAQLAGGSAWFGVVNSFAIIVREGLEAVLLVGAILAYLSASGAGAIHRRRVFAGVALGVIASFATWLLARTLIPVSGASRELIEGVTALLAVAVLLYVSNWLFQKTYIHDWKQYLRAHVGRAVTTGSALAMAGLAFAAVYREGFETVLFYQALLFDAGPGAVLAGFVPGMLLILVVGVLIVRLGVRLPLRTVFGVTNAILAYLAFVFLGKGLYNLQEAGVFAPTPVRWLPDSEALRQIAGIYPVVQTLLAQTALLFGLVGTYLIYRRRAAATPRSAQAAAPRTVQ